MDVAAVLATASSPDEAVSIAREYAQTMQQELQLVRTAYQAEQARCAALARDVTRLRRKLFPVPAPRSQEVVIVPDSPVRVPVQPIRPQTADAVGADVRAATGKRPASPSSEAVAPPRLEKRVKRDPGAETGGRSGSTGPGGGSSSGGGSTSIDAARNDIKRGEGISPIDFYAAAPTVSASASASASVRRPPPRVAAFTGGSGTTGPSSRAGVAVVRHVKGDLFQSQESLAHCISADIAMGKGIAKLFRSKFGGVAELRAAQLKVGECGILQRGTRYVMYLVTKERYFDKPTYMDLQRSLESMRDLMARRKVWHVSMPRIGCGLDKLKWPEVEDVLHRVFDGTGAVLTIYSI